ncbi:hypothetical protein AcW2_005612 [Taiwanofungus camphoratus]|nr:hypothetical protein AcW2_005612 [Antrodia cinnamomea]
MKEAHPEEDHLEEAHPEKAHPEVAHLEEAHLEEAHLEEARLGEPLHLKGITTCWTKRSRKLRNSLENERMPIILSFSLPNVSTLFAGPSPLTEKKSATSSATWREPLENGQTPLQKQPSSHTPPGMGQQEVYTFDKTIEDFNEQFDRLASLAEITEESALIAWYREKLPSIIQGHIMECDVPPTTLAGWKEATAHRDRAYRNNKAIDVAIKKVKTPAHISNWAGNYNQPDNQQRLTD